MEARDQDISAGKSGPIEESDEQRSDDTASDQDISAGKSGPTVESGAGGAEPTED